MMIHNDIFQKQRMLYLLSNQDVYGVQISRIEILTGCPTREQICSSSISMIIHLITIVRTDDEDNIENMWRVINHNIYL
jgi:hypothetical protein